MHKESELWDDSALIDAFDNAMSKYKKMHGLKSSQANVSFSVHQSGDAAIKPRDAGENINAGVITGTETEAANDLEPVEENSSVKLQALEQYIDSTTSLPMQDNQDGNNGVSHLQGAHDYNQLLGQYYEVEERRQTILQQLQQCDSWGYEYSAEGSSSAAQWRTSCDYQEYPIPTSQVSQSTVICSCCRYACQSLVTPCTQYPCCSLAGTSVGKINAEPNGAITCENLPTVIDSDIAKTAIYGSCIKSNIIFDYKSFY
ncbi:NAD(P)-binding Rossmann-fold superfamily protein isoform 1 [Hibiscus syriacus]|uniref:NAD(P)-binding Rossmann-fold superfamily protein isoform 1 n=1 Tax=Hibiscus syriacus TaxID=106335 RepID=A0A6A3AFW2_HIBSY|nr:NAD(P)-binding Rossmann-fold superfamily protein isoform 1 [Hibiscus syriacus]